MTAVIYYVSPNKRRFYSILFYEDLTGETINTKEDEPRVVIILLLPKCFKTRSKLFSYNIDTELIIHPDL